MSEKQAGASLVIDIYGKFPYPEITHIFRGRTREEALHRYDMHLKCDTFLTACVKTGRYRGTTYQTETYWEISDG